MRVFTTLAAAIAVVLAAGASAAAADTPKPAVPGWNTDTMPVALHAANTTGSYTQEALEQIAKYSMITFEKWYTACGSAHPTQAGPECDVEGKFYKAFNTIAEINPDALIMIYLNSQFDFAAYTLHGNMLELEAQGKPAFLRDMHGTIVSLCNDGNFYCNITSFDHTKDYVRQLWLDTLANATRIGNVSGVFADHGLGKNINPDPKTGHATFCNGAGDLATCWNFTNDFAAEWNRGHIEVLNASQTMLAALPKSGPTINGPYAKWHQDPCDFAAMQKVAADETLAVVEASNGACFSNMAHEDVTSCMASFLSHVRHGLYLSCVDPGESRHGGLPPFFEEYTKALGTADGPTIQVRPDVWQRTFTVAASGNKTVVTYNTKTKSGTIEWADGVVPGPPKVWPLPPGPPPPGPTPGPQCGRVLADTGVANFDVRVIDNSSDPAACCDACTAEPDCTMWAWHGEKQPVECHLHSDKATVHPGPTGCFAGVMA